MKLGWSLIMKRKIPFCVVTVLLFVTLCSCTATTDYNSEALLWAKIGALGSWAGSIFGAIALVISLFAFWLPQKVKITATISTGMMLTQIPGIDRIDAYVITVRNLSIKPVTIENIYLNFGKHDGDLFIGMLSQGTPLQVFLPKFPYRLDQGESFNYYLPRAQLCKAIRELENQRPLDAALRIRVDEVVKGTRYFKARWTMRNFVA